MPQIDTDKAEALAKMGVTTLHARPFYLPDDTVFEPPCSIKWMGIQESFSMGAFSYAVSGFYFAVKMGRYVSIGEDVQIGRGSHPINWISTSPFFYQDHKSVLDIEFAKAKDFKPVTPHIAYENTLIGNDVYIGHGAMIMQGLKIGDGAIIGARSVVTKDVPPYSIVAGSPAIVKKMRFNDTILERLSNIRWYDYAFWDLQNHDISRPHQFLDMIEDGVQAGKLKTYQPNLVFIKDLK